MSATDLYVSAGPNSPAASRQPGTSTPYCLPRRATKILAFWLPNPGSAPTRRSSSGPSAAPVQTLVTSLSYCSATTAHIACTRLAIDPGNRCNAGGVEKSVTSSSSGIPAISAASGTCPSRSVSTYGEENAFSSGICWSRTMPIMRASGSRSSKASAAGCWLSISPIRAG